MYLSASHHPTILWQSARMWRAVHMGLDTSMHLLKNLQPTSVGHNVLKTGFRKRRLVGGPKFVKME